MKLTRRSMAAIASCAALLTRDALANGRFPTAQFFSLGEGAARDRIAITTTFGLLVSLDAGERWQWICEDALGFTGEYDPVTAITDSGALVVTLPSGASIARGDWCDFTPIPEAATDPSIDVTARGALVAVSQQLATGGTRVLLSSDDAMTFRRAWRSTEYFTQTIDYAPTNSLLLYATAQDRLGYARILRSDSGGDSFDPTTATPLAMTAATFLAAVDSIDDRRLLLRGFATDGSSTLARSDDSGATVRTLVTSAGAMVGAAATPGFETIWAMSAEEGARLRRSDDGGASFRALATTIRARSLRYRRGVLFATASEQQAGYSFACSQDGGESFRRLLAVDEIRGPDVCGETSTVRTRCAALWPTVRAQLLAIARPTAPPRGQCSEGAWTPRAADAALDSETDSAVDASEPAADIATDIASRDAAAPDAPLTAMDATDAPIAVIDARSGAQLRASGGCQCTTRGARPTPHNATIATWLLLLCALGRSAAARRSAR